MLESIDLEEMSGEESRSDPQFDLHLQSDPNFDLIHTEIEGYHVERKLGHGGFGAVYACRDLGLDRPVAIKIFTRSADQEGAQRFRDEGRLLAKLQHPHIIQVYQVGTTKSGHAFLVMERFGDGSIKDHWPRGACPSVNESIQITLQLLKALDAAHEIGVVHRDIKAANLLYQSQSRQLKLCDFGIARSVERLRDQAQTTREGVVIGTEHYIAPERYRGERHDPRSDLYSTGVLLFRLLTGRRPLERHPGERLTPEVLIYRLFSEPISGLDEIPSSVAQICLKLLEVDRTRRYQSASEAYADLEIALATLSQPNTAHVPPSSLADEHHSSVLSREAPRFAIANGSSPRQPPEPPNYAELTPPQPDMIHPQRHLVPPPVDRLARSTDGLELIMDFEDVTTHDARSASRRAHSHRALFALLGVCLVGVYWLISIRTPHTPSPSSSASSSSAHPSQVTVSDQTSYTSNVKDPSRSQSNSAALISDQREDERPRRELLTPQPSHIKISKTKSREELTPRPHTQSTSRSRHQQRTRRQKRTSKRSRPSAKSSTTPFVYPAQTPTR